MAYSPDPSVNVVRLPSMSAGLAASTVTPGSTPPVSSRTLPAMLPVWAAAPVERKTQADSRLAMRTPRLDTVSSLS